MNKKIAILGSGSWASALAKIIHTNIDLLYWYVREPEIIESLEEYSHNALYVSDIKYDTSKLFISSDINEIVRNVDVIIFCVPSKYFVSLCESITEDISQKQVVNAIKGMVPQLSILISEYFKTNFGVAESNIAVVSGPCHAEEVALERLSYLTIGSSNQEYAEEISKLLQLYYIKTSNSLDVDGIEYASVLKNIMALATGIAHGLGYGDNFTSVLISSAIQEMQVFINTVNPLQRDITNSVYLGDLLVTAYSQFSRNRAFGMMIGKGYSVKSAELEMNMVAEGYYGTKCIVEVNKNFGVSMPIVEAVYAILYDKQSASSQFKKLTNLIR